MTLFATYLNKTLQANTFRVYMAAVSHLHLTHGLSSDNPTLSLAIRGIQCSQDPAHLWPMQLPLTNAILEQRLGLLDSDLLETHDRLIVKAPLTHEFFRFLRVNEFTTQGKGTFDPRIHPTRQGPKMVSSSSKSQRLTKVGRGVTISTKELHVWSLPCRPTSTIARGPNRWLCFTFTLDDLCHLEHCGHSARSAYTD